VSLKGKLIVIEGIDGSGKSTQFDLLRARLDRNGVSFKYQRFPRYDNPSSQLVRMYLAGEFGNSAEAVSPYSASVFYAADRAAAFAGELGEVYENGGLLLLDRYTTANLVHQGAKLEGEEREKYSDWLCDLEYEKLGLPQPDIVILLDMPEGKSLELIEKRGNAADIHEKDAGFLRRCAECARYMGKKYNWEVVSCMAGGYLRTPEDISAEIYARIENSGISLGSVKVC
jgi:dTMP kinase